MDPITIYPKSEEEASLFEQLAKALNVPFKKNTDSPYDPEFVDKIKRSEKNHKQGKFKTIKVEDLWK